METFNEQFKSWKSAIMEKNQVMEDFGKVVGDEKTKTIGKSF
jgi:hypothetical protein